MCSLKGARKDVPATHISKAAKHTEREIETANVNYVLLTSRNPGASVQDNLIGSDNVPGIVAEHTCLEPWNMS